MKKLIFSTTFLLIVLTSGINYANAYSIPNNPSFILSNLLAISISENESLQISDDSDKKQELDKTDVDNDLKKEAKTEAQPSSTKISIGLGKALFEKYIK